MPAPTQRRRAGRPSGGGNSAARTRELLMDAAERSFAQRGYRASTMDVIAAEAGYSRAGMYRQFATRKDLVRALVDRATRRKAEDIAERLADVANPIDMIVESLVIVATELVHDPLIQLISEHSEEGAVAHFIAQDIALTRSVQGLIAPLLDEARGAFARKGLNSADVAQFLISTSVSLLLRLIPGTDDAVIARRYIEVFVLPAIMSDPPHAYRVFADDA